MHRINTLKVLKVTYLHPAYVTHTHTHTHTWIFCLKPSIREACALPIRPPCPVSGGTRGVRAKMHRDWFVYVVHPCELDAVTQELR